MVATGPDESLSGSPAASAFRGAPPLRQRVADHVFESLARAIVTGELKPGEPLATQRELAKQFNVSALVVRQGIHRLEDLGLVRVRQGSTTIVLDPEESSDIRLIQLQMELSEPGPKLAAAALENQSLFVIPLLVLAERRITDHEIAVLNYLVDSIKDSPNSEAFRRFRVEYWRQISKSTQNPLFQQQVRWWAALSVQLDQRGRELRAPARWLHLDFYRALTRALSQRRGSVQLYVEAIQPVLDWLETLRGTAKPAPGQR